MRVTKRKCLISAALEILGAAMLCSLIFLIYYNISINRQTENSVQKLELIRERIENLDGDVEEITSAFDSLYESKADTLALMLRTDETYEASDISMAEQAKLLAVDNVYIIGRSGDILASARSEGFDFSAQRFDQLREVFEPGEKNVPLSVNAGKELRFYSSGIDSERAVVIEKNTEILRDNLESEASVGSILDDIHVGQDGFAFAVSPVSNSFIYYPDSSLQGKNALRAGVDVNRLSDGVSTFMDIDGSSYYCSVAEIGENMIICAVPETELVHSAKMTAIISLIVFLVMASFLVLYYRFIRDEEWIRADDEEISSVVPVLKGRFRYDRKISRKVFVFGAVGLIATFIAGFYMQSLISISTQSITNERRAAEAVETVDRSVSKAEKLNAEYRESYLEKAEQAAFIVGRMDRASLTQDFMTDLRNALRLDSVFYFDRTGKTIATDTDLWNFKLSSNPEDQSCEFRKILEGNVLSVVQDPQVNDSDGSVRQYTGVAVIDDDHSIKGLLQIAAVPEMLVEQMRSTRLENVLPGIQTGNKGFAFAVNSETHIFDYYPDTETAGQKAENCGMAEHQFMPGYSDFISIKGESYYSTCTQRGDELLYIAVPAGSVNRLRAPIALSITAFTLVWLVVFWLVASFVKASADEKDRNGNRTEVCLPGGEKQEMIDVTLADGKKTKTRAISERWNHRTVRWFSRTAEQKLGSVAADVLTVLAIAFLVLMVNADRIFHDESVIHYVLKGTWRKGLNIFAVTDCLIVIIGVLAVSALLRRIIMTLADNMDAKGETICRIADNFIKFAVLIGLLYYCLSLLGVDVGTLVASAGILTLIVGLGANSLVSDVLAGIFIVFEGEFQVGDIVTIDGFRGTVIEIGLRTTKVKEGGGNVKIFSNREVGSVLNMTKDYSVVKCSICVEYGEDLEYVEKVLSKELESISGKLPAIKEGPFYKGVSELGDSSVELLIIAKCAEADRIQLERDLRREMKLIFDRYRISIPFPQVVVNEPSSEFHHITKHDEKMVQRFLEEQREKTGGIAEDEQ